MSAFTSFSSHRILYFATPGPIFLESRDSQKKSHDYLGGGPAEKNSVYGCLRLPR